MTDITITTTKTANEKRKEWYSALNEQLDKLYHYIDSGKFGDTAKTGQFYLARKAVKDKFPNS